MEKKKDIACPYCGKLENVKNGKVRHKDGTRQRFLCKKCGRSFYPDFTLTQLDKRRQAIILYLEGVSKENIARIINIDSATVFQWIKKYGNDLNDIRNRRRVELDKIEDVYGVNPKKSENKGKFYNLIPYRNNLAIIERQNCIHITQSRAPNLQKYEVQISEKKEEVVQHIINRDFR